MVYECKQYKKKGRLGCFWALWKVQSKVVPAVPPERQTDKYKALKPRVKAAKRAQRSQESIWESGGKVGDGAGMRVMECEMCTETTRRGWERQWQ
jgi:hypothetical protein